jgi:hypothetical protein
MSLDACALIFFSVINHSVKAKEATKVIGSKLVHIYGTHGMTTGKTSFLF